MIQFGVTMFPSDFAMSVVEKYALELGLGPGFELAAEADARARSEDAIAHALEARLEHAADPLRALTEAALAAAPVAAYDVDWQAELVVSGTTGELVPYRDWLAMAAAVRRLLSDPGRARSLGVSARERVLTMMSPEALNQHEREQYARLLSQESAPVWKPV